MSLRRGGTTSSHYDDPEEQVRAEFWAELIYVYGYEPGRIGVEVTIPDRTPKDVADIVVFRDRARRTRLPSSISRWTASPMPNSRQPWSKPAGNGTADKFRAEYTGVVAGRRKGLSFVAPLSPFVTFLRPAQSPALPSRTLQSFFH